ncbi:HAD family hydrolase [Halobacteriaceae archaeon SHR40]|uniref:HAD family hydrolase n=1 Tax=Halovenus amylolytica TaxID=2500550 RepID=UPI000FE3FC9D
MNYEGVVYDLDGTLARLRVDWGAVRDDVAGKLQARGVETGTASLWELLEQTDEGPLDRVVEETIAEHEREGARRSDRLPTADELPLDVPVAVCSLNCAAACRIALELHGLDSYVDVLVGRDTVDTHKPDPEPLLYAVQELGVDPTGALFIGDSKRDAVTAERAGVDYEYVSDRRE